MFANVESAFFPPTVCSTQRYKTVFFGTQSSQSIQVGSTRVRDYVDSRNKRNEGTSGEYLDHGPPLVGGVAHEFEPTLASDLVAFVHDLDDDERHAADDGRRHQDEDAGHVLQAQRRRRLLVVLALLADALLDPLLVQLLHETAFQVQHTHTQLHTYEFHEKNTFHNISYKQLEIEPIETPKKEASSTR